MHRALQVHSAAAPRTLAQQVELALAARALAAAASVRAAPAHTVAAQQAAGAVPTAAAEVAVAASTAAVVAATRTAHRVAGVAVEPARQRYRAAGEPEQSAAAYLADPIH